MTRERLPNRRIAVGEPIQWQGHVVHASFGFDDRGRLREVFLEPGKRGTDLAVLLGDVAVLVSLLLQHGCPPQAIHASLGRVSADPALPPAADAPPASLIGAVVARAASVERQEGPAIEAMHNLLRPGEIQAALEAALP